MDSSLGLRDSRALTAPERFSEIVCICVGSTQTPCGKRKCWSAVGKWCVEEGEDDGRSHETRTELAKG